ncbi:MAG: hypothetical protein MK110_13705 [Fuerstiella sp.]|nr:hypothetical protein [Fuerstiella sp.]
MKRIFLTLSLIANSILLYAVWRGLNIGDTGSALPEVQRLVGTHILIGLGALTFAALVHAIALTYFMGTGRFLEETGKAYSLDSKFHSDSQRLKFHLLPGMTVCLLLLVATGAFGAVADRATPVSLSDTLGIADSHIHFLGAILLVVVNIIVTLQEYRAVVKNSQVIDQVLAEVRRMRQERGLPVD